MQAQHSSEMIFQKAICLLSLRKIFIEFHFFSSKNFFLKIPHYKFLRLVLHLLFVFIEQEALRWTQLFCFEKMSSQ